MKVALVHDYLKEFGGAERVLEALHEIFPNAPVFTAYLNLDELGPHADRIKKWDIRTSWFQKFPFASKLVSPFRLFAPVIFENFSLEEYDLVISSCNTYFAKAVITKPGSLHLSYIHTPPRYLYGYTTSFNYKKHFLTRILGELANHILRIYDFETSQRPDILIANSKNVQSRIKKFYRRESIVIYPPVDLSSFPRRWEFRKEREGGYFLSVGRLVRGKGVEVIVEACSELNLPLKVVGVGPQLDNLKKIAGKNVQFLGQVDDNQLPKLYGGALATIVASEDEDFGIVPVESQACGTPVIAPKSGGFLETVIDGKTGLLYGGPGMVSVNALMDALQKFHQSKFDSDDLRKNAQEFSKERFKKEILELVDKKYKLE